MKPIDSGELLKRINEYQTKLAESDTIADREFRTMLKVIAAIKLIIAEMAEQIRQRTP